MALSASKECDLDVLKEYIRKRDKQNIILISSKAKESIQPAINSPFSDFSAHEIDDLSCALLPPDCEDYLALKTKGDGNCLYNSISLLLTGNCSLSYELRTLVACELFLRAEEYAEHEHIATAANHTDMLTDHEDTLFSMLLTTEVATLFDNERNRTDALILESEFTCKNRAWSAMIHILAISSVLKKTLMCVYPDVNKAIRPLFHASVRPLNSTPEGPSLAVMWTRDSDLCSAPGSLFQANHFAALLPLNRSLDETHPLKKCRDDTSPNIQKKPKNVEQPKMTAFLKRAQHDVQKPDESEILRDLEDTVSKTSSAEKMLVEENGDKHAPAATCSEAASENVTSVHHERKMDVGRLIADKISTRHLSSDEKVKYLKDHFIPDSKYQFPKQTIVKGKEMSFQTSWLIEYEWLVYSPSQEGAFCKYCVLFPPNDERIGKTGVLVSIPLKKFSKVKGKDGILTNHCQTKYHMQAIDAAATLLSVHEKPEQSLEYSISTKNKEIFEKNLHILECIIKALLLCGRQNLAIRGHRDDSTSTASNKGNFLAILDLISETDEILKDHLQFCKRNARYTSKTIQNELILIIGDCIREMMVTKNLEKEEAVYSIIADEATDTTSNQEILSVCIRFVNQSCPEKLKIEEAFFDFVHLTRTTGEAIASAIVESLKKNGLDISKVRGQSYDGAAAMSSETVGVQSRIRHIQPLALYTHCSSHVLNLSLSSSCKVQSIRNMMGSVSEVYIFFDTSPKRQRFLDMVIEKCEPETRAKKLKGFCKTRWVERHSCFETCFELYECVCVALEAIVNPSSHPELLSAGDKEETRGDVRDSEHGWQWDKKTITLAQGLLHTLKSGQHVVSFMTAKTVLETVKPLAVKLQKREQDIVRAYSMIDETKENVIHLRRNIDKEFSEIFKESDILADKIGSKIEVPRLAGRQRHRENIEGSSPEEYYRRNVAIPFVDSLKEQLDSRFSPQNRVASSLFQLMPGNVIKLDDNSLHKLSEELKFWQEDLVSPSSLRSEINSWKRFWQKQEKYPEDLQKCLQNVDGDIFPNIRKLLVIGCTLPIGSVEAERTFSTLRRLKTYLRNTMGEERLSGLTLMHMHHSLKVDVREVIDRFIKAHPRRLFRMQVFTE